MLAIRLQRLGRKGLAIYRLAVQDSNAHPSKGRVVAYVGTYNPHTKELDLAVTELQHFLDHGAQPSDRVVKIIKDHKEVKLPKWVKLARPVQNKAIRYPEKLRKNQPKAEVANETATDAEA